MLPQDDIIKLKLIEKMKKTKDKAIKKEKGDLIENCFWIPEKTPESISDTVTKPNEYG